MLVFLFMSVLSVLPGSRRQRLLSFFGDVMVIMVWLWYCGMVLYRGYGSIVQNYIMAMV